MVVVIPVLAYKQLYVARNILFRERHFFSGEHNSARLRIQQGRAA
jgi:hypothetical protein